MNRHSAESITRSESAHHPGSETMAYRPDIDGLRSIAVLSVVAYHAGAPYLSGGFVGVDIFFVISGFLIGRQIFREVEARTFSFRTFYARRMRRILPALFALLLSLTAVGLLLMTPAELREFGKEGIPTVFGLSNVLFYLGGGYFDVAANYDPLLMTWSLGVEEQFYLIFPFLAIILTRRFPKPLTGLILFSLIAFVGSIFLTHYYQKAAFYLLPTRCWELGSGAALAFWTDRKGPLPLNTPGAQNCAGILGLLLLAGSIFAYQPWMEFPGAFALLPVLGTVLLIGAPTSVINRMILSRRPAIFAGKISYSWYLWHWPLFYYFRLAADQGAPAARPMLLIILSFGFAVISWWFVERPFRRRILPEAVVVRRYVLAGCAVAGILCVVYFSNGLPQRLGPEARGEENDARRSRESPCLARYGETGLRRLAACVPALTSAQSQRMMVIGDSHASSIAPGFKALASKQGWGFGELTKSSCLPLLGYARQAPGRPGHLGECMGFQKEVFDYIEAHPEVRVVVLAGYWASGKAAVEDVERAKDGSRVHFASALRQTVAHLTALGKTVILVQDVPTFALDPYARVVGGSLPIRAALGRDLLIHNGTDLLARPIADPSRPIVEALFRSSKGVQLVDPWRAFCTKNQCRYGTSNRLYYFDFQHLTGSGASVAVPLLSHR